MKTLGFAILALVVLIVGLSLWVRLARSDEAKWHVDVAAPDFRPGPTWAVFCPAPGNGRAGAQPPDLERLRAIALDWPRTRLLFGSPESGRMTFVTRTRIMGFPDYTTVGIRDGQLCIVARQRFGQRDGGVNEARVRAWARSYLGNEETPELGWPDT